MSRSKFLVGVGFAAAIASAIGFVELSSLRPLLATLCGLCLSLLLWKLPQVQVADAKLADKERLELENSHRTSLAQMIGGGVLLLGVVLTWQQLSATQASVDVSRRSLALSQEEQITGRFTSSVNQLASSSEASRIGGIYALEQLALESSTYHWPSVEVIATFIRARSPLGQECVTPNGNGKVLCLDVQTALDVLGRRSRKYEQAGQEIDLHNIAIPHASLTGADFRSHQEFSQTPQARYLVEVFSLNISHSDLRNVDFGTSNFRAVNFLGTNLTSSNLQCDNFHDAGLQLSDLNSVRVGCGAPIAIEARQFAPGSALQSDDWSGASFQDADLRNAYFFYVNMRDADFSGADMKAAVLDHVDLRGADLSHACNLVPDQLRTARVDKNTQVPKGQPLARCKHWR